MAKQDRTTRRSLAPMDTWPDLRLIFRLLPWTWKLKPRFYADDNPAAHVSIEWLFLSIEWWAEDHISDYFIEPPKVRDAR